MEVSPNLTEFNPNTTNLKISKFWMLRQQYNIAKPMKLKISNEKSIKNLLIDDSKMDGETNIDDSQRATDVSFFESEEIGSEEIYFYFSSRRPLY